MRRELQIPKLNVLVIGSGAREHAITWKLSQSPQVNMISVAPGNAGTSTIANNIPLTTGNIDELAHIAETLRSDLTIVGPEVPLSNGVVDFFEERGYAIFGPTSAASRIESSKSFARDLMECYNIPSPTFKVFTNHSSALNFINKHNGIR